MNDETQQEKARRKKYIAWQEVKDARLRVRKSLIDVKATDSRKRQEEKQQVTADTIKAYYKSMRPM